MSTMSTQHGPAVRVIRVMDSIPWVRCASGNVFVIGMPLNYFPPSLTQVLGTAGHERVGEEFLEGLGFPKEVTQFVRGHVQVFKCFNGH